MARRTLTVLSACAVASAALVAGAPAASAATTCNTTSGGVFNGTTVCVTTNSAIAGYLRVPYSVGSICVAGACTPAASGTVDVPIVNGDAVIVHGQVCVTYKFTTICVPYTSDLPPFSIG